MADKAYNVNSYTGTIIIPTSDTVVAGTQTISEAINGMTKTIFFTTPNMEATNSTKMQITNSAGNVYFDSGTKAESTTSIIGSEVCIISGDKIIMTAEGTQSANKSITFDVRYLA